MEGKGEGIPVLIEGVDGENGNLLVLLGVLDKVLVGHLLDDDILGDGDHDDVGVELGHIDTHGAEIDDLSHDLTELHVVLLDLRVGELLGMAGARRECIPSGAR